jgi:epoxyqueuosine reductase
MSMTKEVTHLRIAEMINKKALELGYEKCGIIPVHDILDYADRLTERIERLPENREKYNELYRFTNLYETHPWAKSIVICVQRYGKYRIPENLKGMIAKYYLVDGRRDINSIDYQSSNCL